MSFNFAEFIRGLELVKCSFETMLNVIQRQELSNGQSMEIKGLIIVFNWGVRQWQKCCDKIGTISNEFVRSIEEINRFCAGTIWFLNKMIHLALYGSNKYWRYERWSCEKKFSGYQISILARDNLFYLILLLKKWWKYGGMDYSRTGLKAKSIVAEWLNSRF